MLHVAQRLAAGEHLYRDIVFFTGPLPFELLGALFRIVPQEIAVARLVAAGFQGAATAASYAVARRVGSGHFAHAAAAAFAISPLALFPLLSTFYYTPLAMCLGALAAWAATRGLERPAWAVLAGILVAAIALCKQTLGLSYALALVPACFAAAPAAGRRRTVAGLVLGGGFAALATVAWYGLRGDLPDLWRCLVTLPLSLTESYRAPFLNMWPPGELASEFEANRPLYFSNYYFLLYGIFAKPGFVPVLSTQLLYVLPLLTTAISAVLLLTRRAPRRLAPHTAFVFAMAINLFPRSDWGHLVPALPPAVAHLLMLLGVARLAPRLRAVVATSLALFAVGGGIYLGRLLQTFSGPASWGPRVPLRPVSAPYRTPSVPRVIHYLRQRVQPGEPIFVARAEPLLYFATDTTNPTPFTGVLTVLHEEQEATILAALPKLRYVVMSDTDQPLWTYYSHELPGVWKYLERHFRLAPYFPLDDASWIVVLERGEDRGATLVDLVDEAPRARAWIREERGGPERPAPPPPRLVARHIRRPLPMRLSHWGGGIDYDLVVPEGAHFDAGIGYRGMVTDEGLYGHPPHSRMVVSVGRDGAFETVLDQRVDDRAQAGRTWTPVEADLSRFAGQRVTLRLELVPMRAIGPDDLSWWGSPRLFAKPARKPDAAHAQEDEEARSRASGLSVNPRNP